MASKGKGSADGGRRRRRKAGHLEEAGEGFAGFDEGSPARQRAVLELLIKSWEGAVDGKVVNDEMLAMMRRRAAKAAARGTSRPRNAGVTPQHRRHLTTSTKVLTVPAMINWWNSEKLNPAYVLSVLLKRCLERAEADLAGRMPK